jgi:glutaconate CoA-transferase subunit A
MVEGNMLDDESLAPGVIAGIYVEAVAVAARGAWPLGMIEEYAPDPAHLMEYARAARSDAGFSQYLVRHVLTPAMAAAQ